MNKKCYVNPYIFIDVSKGKFIVWNYRTHNEYQLEHDAVLHLLQIIKTKTYIDDKINKALVKAGIISFKPFAKIKWKFDLVSKIFHYGTKDIYPEKQGAKNLVEFSKYFLSMTKKSWSRTPPPELPENIQKLPIVKLPRSSHKRLLNKPLWESLSKRKTSSSFNGSAISLNDLSTLLFATFAKQNDRDKLFNAFLIATKRFRRTSPSGGCMQPAMPYVVVLNVKGLQKGVYFYDFFAHNLRLIRKINLSEQLGYLCADQVFANQLSAGVFITARFDRNWFKYEKISRSYRVILLDIGHLSQTFLLCATAMGLNTWLTAALRDSKIEKLLNVDGNLEQVMLFIGVGKGNNCNFDPVTYAWLKNVWSKTRKL